ncbi:MAG: hypothetical protein LBD37_10445 [Treponema sp.]|jgi:hypothetical protein|nr:hypothetical protein [Treponema sp.]
MKKYLLSLACILLFIFGCVRKPFEVNPRNLDGTSWSPSLAGGLGDIVGGFFGLTFSGNKFKLTAVGFGAVGTYKISDDTIIFTSDAGDFTGEFFGNDSIFIDLEEGTKIEFVRKKK